MSMQVWVLFFQRPSYVSSQIQRSMEFLRRRRKRYSSTLASTSIGKLQSAGRNCGSKTDYWNEHQISGWQPKWSLRRRIDLRAWNVPLSNIFPPRLRTSLMNKSLIELLGKFGGLKHRSLLHGAFCTSLQLVTENFRIFFALPSTTTLYRRSPETLKNVSMFEFLALLIYFPVIYSINYVYFISDFAFISRSTYMWNFRCSARMYGIIFDFR